MFEDLIESSSQRAGRGKTAFLISVLVHTVTTLLVVLIPLVYFQALPEKDLLEKRLLTFLAPPAPPPPPPPPGPSAPTWTPPEIAVEIPLAPDDFPDVSSLAHTVGGVVGSISGGLVGGVPSGVVGGVLGGIPQGRRPPPPPRIRKEPIRVGGRLQASKLLHRVEPEYPELARMAGVSGLVLLRVIVDEEGNVLNIQVLRGHPILSEAAIEAVRQWKYSPMLLNGKPTPVVSTVSVDFVLKFIES